MAEGAPAGTHGEKLALLAVVLMIPALALGLAGRWRRRGCRPVPLLARLFFCVVIGWLAVPLPFQLAFDGTPDLSYLADIAPVGVVQFVLLLPFVALALWQPFYRDRFNRWLAAPLPPQPLAPAPPTGPTNEPALAP